MKIVSLVKFVPDAQFEQNFTEDKVVDRSESVLSELDEYAIEQALILKEKHDDVETIALTMGPEKAVNAVKKALQMGIDSGVHLTDSTLAGSDTIATAKALAAAINKIGDVDIVITGMASTDAETSLVPSMLAEVLAWNQVTLVSEVSLVDAKLTARRDLENHSETVEATLPAIVSVTDQSNTPRYPNFKSILAAKKKEINKFSLADIELHKAPESYSEVVDMQQRVDREAGEIIKDSDTAASQLVDFLEQRNLI
ncbi:MAG: electron transfer flavoprotein subunit beta/FixA family protein [Micrococcaceae bacterium]